MTTALKKSARNLRRGEATMAASVIAAFIECSPTVQDVVREMIEIVECEDSSPEDVEAALNTMFEALFPGKTAEVRACDDALFNSHDFKEAAEALDGEEAAFASRVRTLMEERGMTQEQLARASGISQPAVSNILCRQCRPQRRTVARFAAALGVEPSDLWSDAM